MNRKQIAALTKIGGVGATVGLLAACVVGPDLLALQVVKATKATQAPASKPATTGKPKTQDASAAYAPEDITAFATRFQKDVWPLLSRNCTSCHTASNPSQLHLSSDIESNFRKMLADGHFDVENPAGLLARVTSPDKTAHMPPAPMPAWTDAEVHLLRSFANDLYAKKRKGTVGAPTDEGFPTELTTTYKGGTTKGSGDNTFLTYYQLRGKVKTIFGDEWNRDGKDLYAENIAQFGGADFVKSFNEASRPTAQFLAGVDALGRDVASRSYLTATGPFEGRAANLKSALALTAPDARYQAEIARLYQRMLFRNPSSSEMQAAFRLLQAVAKQSKGLAAQDYDLRFALEARDEKGLSATRELTVHVVNDGYGLGQTIVNQNTPAADAKSKIAQEPLSGPYTFKAGDAGQQVIVSNLNTRGNVLVHAIEIKGPLPAPTTRTIKVDDPTVQAQGGWRMTYDNDVVCYEDDNNNKGNSSVIFPVKVEKDGQYEITLDWRQTAGDATPKKGRRRRYRGSNAENTLVEVRSWDKHRIAQAPPPAVPPKGEAHFGVDMSDDTVSFRSLQTLFKFAPGDGVQISNENTQARVVADAVRFVPTAAPGLKLAADGAKTFLVKAKDATGQADWKEYQKGEYTFYHPVGPRVVSDENDPKLKGKLSLLYKPDSAGGEWKPNALYNVEIGYPGEVQNDPDVPIVVKARESSPIVHVAYPARAHVGATVTLDAGGSYNTQNSKLAFTWRQIGGAQIGLPGVHDVQPSFTIPTMQPEQAGWEALCRALMKHPDFLFTRPLSLATTADPTVRKRLQLVKITQDLLARTPTAEELARLNKGATLASLVDGFLKSEEFNTYYFRRIRLYLESHGTEEDDEPARLWTYIVANDRPFKEILAADYTVNGDWQKQTRPAYYGKSGVLTMKGFIKGKPGLPHYNYAAQVCEKFLGYVFEVPLEVVKIRNGLTAASTTSPSSVCYSCHKILTPLAYQRTRWTDNGDFKEKDEQGHPIDDSDQQLVPSYPFRGSGLEAFSTQAQNKERFIRTIIQTHFVFYFGREMRQDKDERGLYKCLWETEKANNYSVRGLIRTLLTSQEYLNGSTLPAPSQPIRAPFHHPRTRVRNRNLALR